MTTIQRFHTPQPHPSDITGRKAAQLNVQTQEHEAARERLIRDLGEGHGFAYLPGVPGYGTAVIDNVVLDYLRKEFSR